MKKKLVTLLLAGVLLLSATACTSTEEPKEGPKTEATKEKEEVPAEAKLEETPKEKTKEEVKEEKKEPADLSGTWKSEDRDGSWQEATIADGTIEVYWVSDSGNTKSLYWAGSYEAPVEYTEEYTWTSNNDHEKTDAALLASGDDTKDFTYKNGKVSYQASAMGTTTTVELEKQ